MHAHPSASRKSATDANLNSTSDCSDGARRGEHSTLDASPNTPDSSLAEAVRPSCNFKAQLYWDRSACDAAWTKLQSEGVATAFQTSLWIDEVCAHLAKPLRSRPMFVEVTALESGATVMLLALALSKRFGVRTISWLNLGVCDYAAPLIAAGIEWSPEAAQAAWTAIRAALPPADVIDISQIPPDIAGAVNPLSLLPQRRLMELQAFGVPMQGVEGSIVAHTMGAKPFRELGRRRRRLESLGEIKLIEATSAEDVDALFSVMAAQRRRRFERLGRFDLLSRAHYANFYRAAARRSLSEGSTARVFGVSVNGEIISTAYILVHGDVFYGLIITMSGEEWIKYGPGLLVVTELMNWSQKQGHKYHDLSIGDLPYKDDIRPQMRQMFRLLETNTLIGAISAFFRKSKSEFDGWLKANQRLYAASRRLRHSLRRISKLRFST